MAGYLLLLEKAEVSAGASGTWVYTSQCPVRTNIVLQAIKKSKSGPYVNNNNVTRTARLPERCKTTEASDQ